MKYLGFFIFLFLFPIYSVSSQNIFFGGGIKYNPSSSLFMSEEFGFRNYGSIDLNTTYEIKDLQIRFQMEFMSRIAALKFRNSYRSPNSWQSGNGSYYSEYYSSEIDFEGKQLLLNPILTAGLLMKNNRSLTLIPRVGLGMNFELYRKLLQDSQTNTHSTYEYNSQTDVYSNTSESTLLSAVDNLNYPKINTFCELSAIVKIRMNDLFFVEISTNYRKYLASIYGNSSIDVNREMFFGITVSYLFKQLINSED